MSLQIDRARNFILNNRVLNQAEIARSIDWSSASLNQWLHGYRPIPEYKLKKLIEVLTKYGME